MARRKEIRMGVIGVGSMGQGHCNSIRQVPQARLTAVCDVDAQVAKEVGERHGVPFFVNHRDLISAGLCDGVIVSTPHPQRPEIAIECVKAGIHLLSEKPLSETVTTAGKMVRAARKAGVAFAVMFQRRTEPVLAMAIRIAQQGKIGRLMRATLIFPDYRSQAYYDSGTWRATWCGEGGGVLLNQAPHILDVFLKLAGRPTSIIGRTATKSHRIEVEDLAEGLLTFRGGATGYVCCTTNETGPGELMEIVGDKGKLTYRDGLLQFHAYRPGLREFTRTTNQMWGKPAIREMPLRAADRPSGHVVIIRNFVRHILNGEPLIAPGEEGLASLELANALVLSSFRNTAIRLPLNRREYGAFLAEMRKTSKFRKTRVRCRRETDPQHQR